MEHRPLSERVAAVTALDEPVRRALFDLVSRSPEPVSRDAAAAALELPRSTAAFHLDRLAAEGLVAVEYQRLTGRTGPGAGRPAKLYRRSSDEVAVSVPERHYELAGHLLAAAIEESEQSGQPPRTVLRRLANDTGRAIGAASDSLEHALEDNGFEPSDDADGGIVLGNCPFHQLAREHTDIVCQLNFELLQGVAAGVGDTRHTIVVDTDVGRCCVRAALKSD